MEKKSLMMILLLFAHVLGFSQINLQPVIPVAGVVQKNNLWNVLVVNSTRESITCTIDLVLRDRRTGLEVLTATSGQFILETGAKQLNASLLLPILYNEASPNFLSRTDDLIPIGSYVACYRLNRLQNKVLLIEECVALDVEPLSPPMLVFPSDSTVLNALPSSFSWVPPSPFNLFSRLSYQLLIAEIYPGQKPAEAIQQNTPFYMEYRLQTNQFNYPPSMGSFEKEKWYAWQVIANDENSYAAKTDVWVFKIQEAQNNNDPSNGYFLLMEEFSKGTYTIQEDNINLKLVSTQPAYKTNVEIRDDKGQLVRFTETTILQGDNYIPIKLGNRFSANKIYSVSIVEPNTKKIYALSFQINAK